MKKKDPTALTAIPISVLLPKVLLGFQNTVKEQGPEVLAAWPAVVGEQIAKMTRPLSFVQGILTVAVSNSALYALLVRQERPRLLALLRARFPRIMIHNINFRMG